MRFIEFLVIIKFFPKVQIYSLIAKPNLVAFIELSVVIIKKILEEHRFAFKFGLTIVSVFLKYYCYVLRF